MHGNCTCIQNASSPQLSPRIGARSSVVRPGVTRGRQQRDQLATVSSSMMQAFQPPAAAAGASDHGTGTAASQVNAVCGMRNSLLVAADSVTDAVSSLVKELNSGMYTHLCVVSSLCLSLLYF